jgi:hypothetical protein
MRGFEKAEKKYYIDREQTKSCVEQLKLCQE